MWTKKNILGEDAPYVQCDLSEVFCLLHHLPFIPNKFTIFVPKNTNLPVKPRTVMINDTAITPKRLLAFDYLKAIAIILVVIGHWQPDNAPEWWALNIRFIYSFHMPVFLAASGFLFAYTYRPQKYTTFISKKFKRLMVPYLSVSLVVFALKLLTEHFTTIENPVNVHDFLAIFYYPKAGFFLWFLWTLWWCFVITPCFKTRESRLILFLCSFIIAYLPFKAPEFMCLRETQEMMVYFIFGVIAYDYKKIFDELTRLNTVFVLSFFFICEALYLCNLPFIKYALSYLGIIAMLNISFQIERHDSNKWAKYLLAIGSYSFGIYLFHTTFEGLAKTAITKVAPSLIDPQNTLYFLTGSTIIILTGIILPILLYRLCLNKFKITRFLFAGIENK